MLLVVAMIASVATAGAMDDEMAELARMIRDECVAETGVAPALLRRVDEGAMLPPDPQLKCYIKCTMETAGMMSDGEVDVEAVLALLPDGLRSETEAGLRACATKKGADDCDTAFQTQLCWQNANKEHYILI